MDTSLDDFRVELAVVEASIAKTTRACRYRQEFEGIKSPRNLGSYNHTTEGKPAWMAANLPLNTTDADHFDEVCSCFVLLMLSCSCTCW